ncbi:hypothetical protein HELRODRAFT_168329 [Helobdella robusta]|uniref:Uncharacterized protein n=1 Tax=Helobdella robusta TaxID=6412 RepID=T1F0F8_HELRO|nr:hypothetical protein HELRODRAFT_168329 [Helobdella robusta]ESO09356.1 hypothetical protein HELRODRAFT_168329 [Helobdella robusta]
MHAYKYRYMLHTPLGMVRIEISIEPTLGRHCTIKQQKKELKQLKAQNCNNVFNTHISKLSKLIRERLRLKSSKKTCSAMGTNQFNNNFWRACKSSFSSSTNVAPQYNVADGETFFRNGLIADARSSFQFPDWIHPLPEPSVKGDIDKPTYKEVVAIVRRCKAKATPCPLD